MAIYLSTKFSTAEEFEQWLAAQEHENKEFLDGLCKEDKEAWDSKACKMRVKDGKLQLLCAKDNVLAEADYVIPDNDTVCCDEAGAIKVKGIENANKPNGKKIRIWAGTQAEYDAITKKDTNIFYFITDDTTKADLKKAIEDIAKNAENISKNAEDIAKNAENISKNAEDIAKNAENISKNAEDISGIFDGSKPVGAANFANKMKYTLKAKGSWEAANPMYNIDSSERISKTNFIKPNTRYLIKADGVLMDAFSNNAGTEIRFHHIATSYRDGSNLNNVTLTIHDAKILFKEGQGLYWAGTKTYFTNGTHSGEYTSQLDVTLTHIYEGETITID